MHLEYEAKDLYPWHDETSVDHYPEHFTHPHKSTVVHLKTAPWFSGPAKAALRRAEGANVF